MESGRGSTINVDSVWIGIDMLKFYDESHQYEYNGKIIPSVSELLRFLSREVYDDINTYVLDRAAERGTSVHEATQQIDQTGACEVDSHLTGYVEAYAVFVQKERPKWLYSEQPFAHSTMLYAGTPDRVGTLRGQQVIVDIKTNAAIKKPLVKCQLNAYRELLIPHGFTADALYCLQLMATGKYRLYPVAIDNTEFYSCYNMHYALKRKSGRGRID